MVKLALLVVGLCMVLGVTEKGPAPGTHADVRLMKNKPTVYITLERTGPRKPLHESESGKGVWLKLHNNTKWKLVFSAGGVPDSSYGDVVLFYEIDRTEGSGFTPIGYRSHLSSVVQLKAGDSFVFSLPVEHLEKGLAIRVRYNYEWELSQDGAFVREREPEHIVSFESSGLPYR